MVMTKTYARLPFFTPIRASEYGKADKFAGPGRLAEKVWDIKGNWKSVTIIDKLEISNHIVVKTIPKEKQKCIITASKISFLVLFFPVSLGLLAIKLIYRWQNKFIIQIQPKKSSEEQEKNPEQLIQKAENELIENNAPKILKNIKIEDLPDEHDEENIEPEKVEIQNLQEDNKAQPQEQEELIPQVNEIPNLVVNEIPKSEEKKEEIKKKPQLIDSPIPPRKNSTIPEKPAVVPQIETKEIKPEETKKKEIQPGNSPILTKKSEAIEKKQEIPITENNEPKQPETSENKVKEKKEEKQETKSEETPKVDQTLTKEPGENKKESKVQANETDSKKATPQKTTPSKAKSPPPKEPSKKNNTPQKNNLSKPKSPTDDKAIPNKPALPTEKGSSKIEKTKEKSKPNTFLKGHSAQEKKEAAAKSKTAKNKVPEDPLTKTAGKDKTPPKGPATKISKTEKKETKNSEIAKNKDKAGKKEPVKSVETPKKNETPQIAKADDKKQEATEIQTKDEKKAVSNEPKAKPFEEDPSKIEAAKETVAPDEAKKNDTPKVEEQKPTKKTEEVAGKVGEILNNVLIDRSKRKSLQMGLNIELDVFLEEGNRELNKNNHKDALDSFTSYAIESKNKKDPKTIGAMKSAFDCLIELKQMTVDEIPLKPEDQYPYLLEKISIYKENYIEANRHLVEGKLNNFGKIELYESPKNKAQEIRFASDELEYDEENRNLLKKIKDIHIYNESSDVYAYGISEASIPNKKIKEGGIETNTLIDTVQIGPKDGVNLTHAQLYAVFAGSNNDLDNEPCYKTVKEHFKSILKEQLNTELTDLNIWNALKMLPVKLQEQISTKNSGASICCALVFEDSNKQKVAWTLNSGDTLPLYSVESQKKTKCTQLAVRATPRNEDEDTLIYSKRFQQSIKIRGGSLKDFPQNAPLRGMGYHKVKGYSQRPQLVKIPLPTKNTGPDHKLILTTNGVSKVIANEIGSQKATDLIYGLSPVESANKLIEQSAKYGSTTNNTVLVIDLTPSIF